MKFGMKHAPGAGSLFNDLWCNVILIICVFIVSIFNESLVEKGLTINHMH